MPKTGIVILAAGASTRLGQPKQQLLFKGLTLLQHALQTAQAAALTPAVVVLGAGAATISANTNFGEAYIIENPDWAEGMASSIKTGLSYLLKLSPELEAVILMVCDQPFVNPDLLNSLISTQKQTAKAIVACAYQETTGTPVLFTRKLFPDLRNLHGQEGAKKLLKIYPEAVATISFPAGAIDIDTRQDYRLYRIRVYR